MGDWREEYQRKLVSPDEAVRCIESGDQVFTYHQGGKVHSGCLDR